MYYVYPKRRDKVYYYAFLFSFFCLLNYLPQGLESLLTNFQLELFFGQICAVGFIFIPITWFFICYVFSNEGKDLTRKYKILLLIIPVFCLIGALTNPWTGQFYSNIANIPDHITYQLTYTNNWINILNILYAFFTVILSLIVLIKELFTGKKIYRKNLFLLLSATIISFIASIYAYFSSYPGSEMILFIVLSIDMLLYDSLNIMPIVNKNVIKDIDIGVSFFDKNNKLLSVNPASSMLNLTEKDINLSVDKIFENHEKFLDFYYDENADKLEIPIKSKWINVTKKNIIKYNEYLGKELTIEDITSKKIELDQKDVLIKEVHHRVKSNLQIILSLLNIDLHYHPNEPMIVLNDTRVRLNYMSNLHEYIYKQSEFTEVNIKEYLPQVAESLFKMYDNDITVHENLKDTVISMDLAIPLGLILTEVINNTIQYGFPNGESGEFILESQEDNGDCVIIMGNNGVDLPSDFDMDKSNTLGLTIIKSLTQELEGSFKMVSDNGVKVIIKFPIN